MARSPFVVLIIAVAVWYYWPQLETLIGQIMSDRSNDDVIDSRLFDFDEGGQKLIMRNIQEQGVLGIRLGQMSNFSQGSTRCTLSGGEVGTCLHFNSGLQMKLRGERHGDIGCLNVEWQATERDELPMDCVEIADAYWYGGSEMYHQYWPVEKMNVPMQPYLSSDILQDIHGKYRNSYGSVIERYWINSRGVGIVVDNSVPLHVSVNSNNDKLLCFKSDYKNSPYEYVNYGKLPFLNYRVCAGDNIKAIHKFLSDRHFDKPDGIPDQRMFKSPIWSTWARYKMDVNQTIVVNFAREIRKFGFSNSQIEIDDIWSPTYGDIEFSVEKFPKPAQMIGVLQRLDFRVTAWVTPFANTDSEAYAEGMREGYWVMDCAGESPALVKWWQGTGALLDVTNIKAVDWYVERLRNLKRKVELDSYKFDAGEVVFLPSSCYKTHEPLENPSQYTVNYVKTVSRLGDQIEVRVGHQTQRQSIFVRMFDKDSKWGYDNGLKTMIPTALIMGILGYPFVLPDMIGGNAYSDESFHVVEMPERELFIRWMQLTAYMPSMQFSISPWQYDIDVVKMALQMVKIHEEIVTPLMLRLAEESTKTGAPIMRPLWWIAPNDEEALSIDSEYLIGDDLLVAPILERGALKRDVYLPHGLWKGNLDEFGNIEGGKWLKDYRVELDEIATFTRISQGER
ncbi:myogenesis-regulating glycosidase-like [Ptychodera flava]|uniref:myogenesis-regulating glycosidase-like n=1 Tax=Ptychodera flava TaxID=63121 RepID=UPI003969C38A